MPLEITQYSSIRIIRQSTMNKGKYQWLYVLDYISIAVFVVGLVWWAVWTWAVPNILISTTDLYTPYLLSAIAQSLAAVLALVFTISLIVAQISARYSYRVFAVFFDVYTMCYIALFVTAVLLPLWLLGNQNASVNGIKCTLVLSSVCLVLLIPYFIRFRMKLTPEYMLSYLASKALAQLKTKPDIEPESAIKIQDIVMSAFALKDYETCRQGINSLAFLAYEANQLEMPDSESPLNTYIELYKRLDYIFKVTSEDPMIPIHIVRALLWNGTRAIEEKLPNVVNDTIIQLISFSYEAVDKGLDEVASEAVSFINLLNRDLARKRLKSLKMDTFFFLRSIGIDSAERGLKDTLDQCISGLRQIGEQLIENRKGGSLVKKIVAELSELYKGVSNVMSESIDTICEELIVMGTISHILKEFSIRDYIIGVLKDTIGTHVVKRQYSTQAYRRWHISVLKHKYKNFTTALGQFVKMVE